MDDQKKYNKITIAPQTKVMLVGYILIFTALVLASSENSQLSISSLMIFIIVSILGMYVLNCTVVGHCHIYAWIISYIFAIIGIMLCLTMVWIKAKQ
jgi:hypothetical protein